MPGKNNFFNEKFVLFLKDIENTWKVVNQSLPRKKIYQSFWDNKKNVFYTIHLTLL